MLVAYVAGGLSEVRQKQRELREGKSKAEAAESSSSSDL